MKERDRTWKDILDEILYTAINIIWFAIIVCGADSLLYRLGVQSGRSAIAAVVGFILFCIYSRIKEKKKDKEIENKLQRVFKITEKYNMSIADESEIIKTISD